MNRALRLRADKLPTIKMCGMRRVEDIVAAREAGADLIGLVFAPSRRQVTATDAAAMLAEVGAHPPVVGVFVNQEPAAVRDIAQRAGLDLAQLSGDETPEDAESLGLPYVKTIHLKDGSTLEEALRAMRRHPTAAAYLLDSWCREGGGSGVAPDWVLVKAIIREASAPVFLAGGLSSENVALALATTGARGVDVSSGIEIDGWKDRGRMLAFVRQAGRSGVPTVSK